MKARVATRRLYGHASLRALAGLAKRVAGSVRWLPAAAIEVVLPATCASCHEELPSRDSRTVRAPICDRCLDDLPLFKGPTCARCGAATPALAGTETGCKICRGAKLWFDEALALGAYDGLLRDWLLAMKQLTGDALSLAVGDLIWQQQGERLAALRPDVIVPVPMHWRRRCLRGTNSAGLIAERLAARTGAPLAAGLLRRLRHTAPQFSLPPSQRRGNVRRAFSVRADYHLEDARVVLVDDILTTCATCSEASRALKRAGAGHVAVVAAARTMQH